MLYKFEHLSQKEVEIMLGITLQETRVYREIKAEGREEGIVVGREEGREEATTNLILRQLTRRFGAISEDLQVAIAGLPLHKLEDLSEALLDFTSLADLQAWLGSSERALQS